jgi:hypothetical protein
MAVSEEGCCTLPLAVFVVPCSGAAFARDLVNIAVR